MTGEKFDDVLDESVAIIGMVCRFPDANDTKAFWDNLKGGLESVKIVDGDELRARGFASFVDENPNFLSSEATLADEVIRNFDASFFNMSPREAEIMDPQHRLFLEACWELFEQAGYSTEQYRGRVGVFGSTGFSGYLESNLLPNRKLLEEVGSFQTQLGNDKDFIATRVSYKMGFTGASMSVSTLCSSAAVAIHLARESLLNFQNDLILAGGVNISISNSDSLYYQEGGIGASDGHCRAYDERASGTVSGSGLGVIALKRLQDAIDDGDNIVAVIIGSAVNNDGSNKASYTAPSPEGQANVISEALAVANVSPETIELIDGHGTATNIGDPIEISALTKAYRQHTDKKQYCGIGSVKTNIGHLVTAGGVASLIKAALSLEHKFMPPSLNFERANPKIDFANSPFYVNHTLQPWSASEHPRRAAVSSFGIGGTNVHIILEEAPFRQQPLSLSGPELIVLSAKSESALEQMCKNLHQALQENADWTLADIAYTLKVGRNRFEYRRYFVCRSVEELRAQLLNTSEGVAKVGAGPLIKLHRREKQIERNLCFMFPGQGSQYAQMAKNLYLNETVYQLELDRCAEYALAYGEADIRAMLFGDSESHDADLQDTRLAQLSLFATEYALAQLWISKGVKPESMVGHSLGEYVAACIAGVFSLENAVKLVCRRAKLMAEQSTGSMLSVAVSEQEAEAFLSEEIELAAINGTKAVVVSGATLAITALMETLTAQGTGCCLLKTSHAFHSSAMESAAGSFARVFDDITLSAPAIPFVSNLTGDWISDSQATSVTYWQQHMRQPVQFYRAVKTLTDEHDRIFLEVGPGCALTQLVATAGVKSAQVVSSLPGYGAKQQDVEFFTAAIGQLWLAGYAINWQQMYNKETRRRIPLPTYPFERKTYWIEPVNTWAVSDRSDVKLTKIEDIAALSDPTRPFINGKIVIDIDWQGKNSARQKQQLVAIMELKKQLMDICADLSNANQVVMTVSELGLNWDRSVSDSADFDAMQSHKVSERPALDTRYYAPTTPIQEKMCQQWQTALGVSSVGIRDSFFDLGGHSLIAAALINYIRQEFKVDISLVDLLESPTIENVCQLIEAKLWLRQEDRAQEMQDDTETLVI